MRSLNLQAKIVIYTVGVIAASIIVLTSFNLMLDFRTSREHFRDHVADLAGTMVPSLRQDFYFNRLHNLRRTAHILLNFDAVDAVELLDPEGYPLTELGLPQVDTGTLDLDSPPSGYRMGISHLWYRKGGISALTPIQNETGAVAGYLYLEANHSEQSALIQQRLSRSLILGGLIGLVGCLVGFLAGRNIAGPLQILASAASEMAEGRNPGKIKVKTHDEVHQLVSAFNNMVDQRRSAVQSLERSRQHLLFVLNEVPLGYIEWDLDFRVISWNKAAQRIFGYSFDEAYGRHAVDLIVPENVFPQLQKLWVRLVRGDGGGPNLNENVRADGSRILCRWNNAIIRNSEGLVTSIACLVEDVTEVVRNQESLQEALETARMATNAKSDFLANMSHEIRTPMNGVIGMTDLLLESDLPPEQKSYVEVIRSSGEMLLTIINDILDLSKIESGKLELSERVFDLQECLSSSFHLFTRALQAKELQSSVDLDAQVPRFASGDPVRLRQILYNLLSNAVKFTAAGRIGIRAWIRDNQPETFTLEIAVTDTGPGIPEDQQEAIFEPFDQGKTDSAARHGGTGLGLTICKRLCQMMQGDVRIHSTSPEGTEFRFCVKLHHARHLRDQAAPITPETPQQDDPGKRWQVLIVEDNPVNQLVTKRILQKLGCQCSTAGDGAMALEYLAANPCELIFMDLQMPVLDGFQTTARIRESFGSSLFIVALTASAIEGDRERCLAAGMDDYIAKPVKMVTVRRVLRELQEKGENPS